MYHNTEEANIMCFQEFCIDVENVDIEIVSSLVYFNQDIITLPMSEFLNLQLNALFHWDD